MSSTISETIAKKLAHDIVTGVIAPGMRLEEKMLADQFHVSRTPVRDALRQLAATGLVEFRPRRGVTVADIGTERLHDMYEAQSELEGLCARLCAQRMTALERRKLESIHAQAGEAVRDRDVTRYSQLNEELHALIYRGAHNDSICELTVAFRRRLAPFRASVFFRTHGRMTESHSEHGEIIGAILDADPERAYAAIRDHVLSSSVNVIDYLEKRNSELKAAS